MSEMVSLHPAQRSAALEWALVAGLVAIFLANAIAAIAEPASYRHILEASPISRAVGLDERGWSTALIAASDGAIGTGLVLSAAVRRVRRPMLALAGAWLAIAGLLKLSATLG